MDPVRPRPSLVCAYIEELAESPLSPRTVMNNISHIRTYLRKADMPTAPLDHIRVKWALDALKRDVSFTPRLKQPIPTDTLQSAVSILPSSPEGNIIKVSVLIMFYAALRQSEVLAPSVKGFDHRFHLARKDVILLPNTVQIYIKHAKNMQTIYQNKLLSLQASSNPLTCVMAAVRQMLAYTPTIRMEEPFIMFPDTRKPVTVDFVRRRWNSHLTENGVNADNLSLHSLRKAAATAAHDQGCSEIQIQRYGGWKSNAHRYYIHTTQSQVNAAITSSLS